MEKEEKLRRFREKQAEMRAAIRQVREEAPGDREAMAGALGATLEEEKTAEGSGGKKAQKKLKAKPKWALTAAENEDVEDLEVDDLLEFTHALDFERYIDDLEVKEALKFVQDRVADLEAGEPKARPGGSDGEDGEDGEDTFTTLADPGAAATLKKRERREKQPKEDDAVSTFSESSNVSTMSKSVRDGHARLKGVHSNASVEAMIKRQQVQAQPVFAVPEPWVATSKERETLQTDASNLPYLHRSPHI